MPFLIALAVALVMTPVAAKLGSVVGFVDRPVTDLKIHTAPVPVLGGPAVVAAALGAAVVGPRYPASLFMGVVVALGAGLLDDLRSTPPWARLVLQAAAGGVLVAAGLALAPFGTLGGIALVLLTVACANSANLLDGQDGLAGGLGVFAALGLAALAAQNGVPSDATLGLALAGALAGFLVFNRPPARIYLGNGGAYAVGALLAALAAVVVGQSGWRGVLTSGVCLAVYAFELVFTMLRRILTRRPIASGDRQHAYDVLSERIGRNRSTLAFWGLGAIAAGLGLLADALGVTGAVVITLIVCVAGVAVAATLLRSGEARLRRVR